jgi:hypothetical protein
MNRPVANIIFVYVEYFDNCTSKRKVQLMLQKSSGKIRMPIPNSSIETTLFGIRRTPKKQPGKPG